MPASAPAPELTRWIGENRAAIRAMHDPKARHAALRAFDGALARVEAPPRTIPPRDFSRAAARELATPGRYRLTVAHANPKRSLLSVLGGWVIDRWNAFLRALQGRIHVSGGGRTAIGDVLIVVFALLVAVIAARLLGALQLRNDSAFGSTPLPAHRNAHALALAATGAAEAGAYAQAVRLLFAAAVTLLDLRGAVRDDASATVNELRRALRERAPSADDAFVTLARAYTETAYAELPPNADDWRHARAAYDRLSRGIV